MFSLRKEGWTRHQEDAAKQPLKGADGGWNPRKPDRAQPLRERRRSNRTWLVSDHPVCAISVASRHFLDGAATPPYEGGEYKDQEPVSLFIDASQALTYCRTPCMVCHMKTTLNIDDKIMRRLKEESVRQGRTMSDLLESALRSMFRSRKSGKELPPLPTFVGGVPRVNVANRESLEDFMEGR